MELTHMDMEDIEGMHWARMESITGFLIYLARKYRYINPYLKGLHLMLDILDTVQRKIGMEITGDKS